MFCPKIEPKTRSLLRSPQAPLIKGGIKGGIKIKIYLSLWALKSSALRYRVG